MKALTTASRVWKGLRDLAQGGSAKAIAEAATLDGAAPGSPAETPAPQPASEAASSAPLNAGAPADRRGDGDAAASDPRRPPMSDRRLDPRTDASFSLKNLLRLRTARNDYALTVVGTPDGYVMAGSRGGDPAEETAAQASLELFVRAEEAPFGRVSRRTPSGRLSGMRFEVEGRPLFVALVDQTGQPREHEDDHYLDAIAERIQAILVEQRRRIAA